MPGVDGSYQEISGGMMECQHKEDRRKRIAIVDNKAFEVVMCDRCFFLYMSFNGYAGSGKPESLDDNYYRDNQNDNAISIYEAE